MGNATFEARQRALLAEALAAGELPAVDVDDIDIVIDHCRVLVRRARANGQHTIAEKLRTSMKTTEFVSTEIVEQEATKQAQEQAAIKPQNEAAKKAKISPANGSDKGSDQGTFPS